MAIVLSSELLFQMSIFFQGSNIVPENRKPPPTTFKQEYDKKGVHFKNGFASSSKDDAQPKVGYFCYIFMIDGLIILI